MDVRDILGNPDSPRIVRLVGGPMDSELLAVKEKEWQVSFFSHRVNTIAPEKVEYYEHTYVRDPDSFDFIYAGAVPVSEERVSGRS